MPNHIIYIFISIAALLYFLFRKRHFDFVSLAFFSSFVYFMPLFAGYTRGQTPNEMVPIYEDVYFVGIFLFIALLMTAECVDLFEKKQKRICKTVGPKSSSQVFLYILVLLASVGLAGTILTAGTDLLLANKQEMMSHLTKFHILMTMASIIGGVFCFISHRRIPFFFFFFVLLFDVFIGFRSSIAIFFLSIATIWLFDKGRQPLIKTFLRHWKQGLVVIICVLSFFMYKQIYSAVKLHDINRIVDKLSNTETYTQAFLAGEPFTTQAILNEIIKIDFQVDANYLVGNIYQVIPFSNRFLGETMSFNAKFQPYLFSEISYGMASNWWAEWYSLYGWIGIFFAVLIYVSGIILLSYYFIKYRFKPIILVLIIIFGSFWCFYIHRNEIGYFINLEKRVLWLWGSVLITSLLVSSSLFSKSHD